MKRVVLVSAAAAAVIIGIILLANGRSANLEGTYVAEVRGKPNWTRLIVEQDGDHYVFTLAGENDLRSRYQVPRNRDDRYVLIEPSGEDRFAELTVSYDKGKLDVEGWVLPVGRVSMTFGRPKESR